MAEATRPIGWTRRGRPVWPQAGGSGDGGEAGETTGQPAAEPAGNEPTSGGDGDPGKQSTDPPPDGVAQETWDALGDPGKRALKAERDRAAQAEQRAKELEGERDKLKQAQMTAEEKAVEDAKAEARSEALATARQRILSSEVHAHAAGKLDNPQLAERLVDTDDLIDDDLNVDTAKLTERIDRLIEDNPGLAPAKGTQAGSKDAGARSPGDSSPSMDDLLRAAAGR